jgi:hypothetical protein
MHKTTRTKRYMLNSLSVFCFVVTIVAIVGSVRSIIVDASSYDLFNSNPDTIQTVPPDEVGGY